MKDKNKTTQLSKKKLTVGIIVGCVLGVVAGQAFLQYSRSNVATSPAIPAKAKGNPEAKLKIIEYIDFQCPACAQGMRVLKDYAVKYPDQIYIEIKNFPLAMHQFGMVSARYAECAARQKKFWPFVDLLMDKQGLWASLHDPLPAFRQFAQQAGLNASQLESCLNDKYLDETIHTERSIGSSLGVQSTPTYFINDKMFVGAKALKEELTVFFKETTPVSPQ